MALLLKPFPRELYVKERRGFISYWESSVIDRPVSGAVPVSGIHWEPTAVYSPWIQSGYARNSNQ